MRRKSASPRLGAAAFGVAIASSIASVAPAHAAVITSFISITAFDFRLLTSAPAMTPPISPVTADSFFTFDTSQTYDNVTAPITSFYGDFSYPVTFSFDPGSNVLTLGTVTSPGGCAAAEIPADGFCLSGLNKPTQGFITEFYQRTSTGDLYLSTSINNGVPEPASWALMIVGLGGVGAAMRGRRRPATSRA